MQVTTPEKVENKSTFGAPVRIPAYPEIYKGENNARRIISVCRHYSAHPLETLTALQLGSSTGILTESFAQHFRRVIAVDSDQSSLHFLTAHKVSTGFLPLRRPIQPPFYNFSMSIASSTHL